MRGNHAGAGVIVLIFVCVFTAAAARGQIGFFFRPVTIRTAAIVEQPQLANYSCIDFMVVTSGDWDSAQVRLTLPAGMTFFKHPVAGNTKPYLGFPVFPSLEYSTYVTGPSDAGGGINAPLIDGGWIPGEPFSLGDATSVAPGVFSGSWRSPLVEPPGTYQFARFTFPTAAGLPSLPLGPLAMTSQINPPASTGILYPEPSVLGFVATCTMFLRPLRRGRGT